jgi:hypothetical protein
MDVIHFSGVKRMQWNDDKIDQLGLHSGQNGHYDGICPKQWLKKARRVRYTSV